MRPRCAGSSGCGRRRSSSPGFRSAACSATMSFFSPRRQRGGECWSEWKQRLNPPVRAARFGRQQFIELLSFPPAIILQVMTDVTRILSAIQRGDPHAAAQLLPLVYDELRKLAAQKLAHEKPGQTLDATGLVHEAYLRLVASGDASASRERYWNSRGHFFAAA